MATATLAFLHRIIPILPIIPLLPTFALTSKSKWSTDHATHGQNYVTLHPSEGRRGVETAPRLRQHPETKQLKVIP